MSYEFTVWKWRTGTRRPPIADVLAEINKDDAHPALARFDRVAFEGALQRAFGNLDDDNSPLQCELADYCGLSANWAGVSVSWSQVEEVFASLVKICESQGLTLYDWVSEEVVVEPGE
jgi:hypothetical protein